MPLYAAPLEYPYGHRVQNVLLTEASGFGATSVLNIPLAEHLLRSSAGTEQDTVQGSG